MLIAEALAAGRALSFRQPDNTSSIKPGIVFGTESWLKGIEPGKNRPQTLSNPAKSSQAITNH
ncbi:hypothetical protein DPMN_165530 [Dreissena polymorpha]|uniref:Uncharacterized protein n=1 Tax=Dreissena polymorpha TaxID=45954 RepID=A0A9D4EZU9_DREPO|nr:hypothetical protein DPMN_165530 [Dreissena polymorpha]